MIHKMSYTAVDTDLSINIDDSNLMGIRVKFTHFIDELNTIKRNYDCIIPFIADTKYDKIISLSLTKDASIIIDERFNDPFYYETININSVDKICWFTLPVNFSDPTGLNAIDVYVKGGV